MEKFRILHSFVQARWFSNFSNRNSLKVHQEKLWKKQISFIKKRSFYYSQRSDFPIMSKELFMKNFDHINTVGISKEEALALALESEKARQFDKKLKGITVGLSSGTSGHRGLFLVSDKERSLWAGTILAKVLPRGNILGHRVAFFMRANSELYETIQSRFIHFKFFDMLDDMEENIEKVKKFKPTILVAPPSCLSQIAAHNHKKEILPQKIISIAEVLENRDADLLKQSFSLDVIHQIYQCTEGFLGVTCAQGSLHINEDFIIVEKEYLDKHRFFPIITDLRRHSQPIIRYRLNDILIEKKSPCPCGSPFLALEKIEGRQDDMFEFEGPNGKINIFPDFIRRCLLFVDGITEYRVQQVAQDKVYVLADNLTEQNMIDIINEFKNLAEKNIFNMPKVYFKPYKYQENKKLRRIEKLC
ncbi:CoF synthetase [Lactococcus lactis subsp. lactis]|nr:CoF synthetase [Lactococcus lactis subsp. lactis]